jgi:hypothetical protein
MRGVRTQKPTSNAPAPIRPYNEQPCVPARHYGAAGQSSVECLPTSVRIHRRPAGCQFGNPRPLGNLLVAQGFKPISQFSPDPAQGCHVVDQDGAFSKQTQSRWTTNRWFSVIYLVCDGHLRFDVSSSGDDSLSDAYLETLVKLLRHELDSELTSGQVIVRTKQYVALGP